MITQEMINAVRGFLDAMKPTPLVNISQWADDNRRLTSESSAEPGRWSTDRTPYLREIMDSLSPMSPITEVILAKGVQLGATESGLNMAGCYMDIDPCPIMYVMPTIEMAKAISESRVDPMIENSPSLSDKVRPNKERDSGNTKFHKRFPGGILVLSGANSAASLRSRPVRVLILDEVDAYPLNVDDEGSPISLAEKRTSTYGAKKKIYKLSTPTVEGVSVIQDALEATEQRKFYVPCPDCDATWHLEFTNLKWDKGKPETVKYCCPDCGSCIEERHKTSMMARGEWRATVPDLEMSTRRGYHINSLYSPLGWLSWAEIARQFEDAEKSKDDNLMKVFVNTILGQTWKTKGEAPDWQNLYNRRENYKPNRPPKEVAFLTCGVDIQRDRIELEITGWCKGKRTYSIDYRVLVGDTSAEPVWMELAKVVDEQWEREDGVLMPLKLMGVDSGYNTTMVYKFCGKFDSTRVVPMKGQDKQDRIVAPPRQVHTTKGGRKIGKVKIWNIGVNILKSELYGWLRLELDETGVPPDGYCHFPEYDHHYFKMLTAEQIQTKVIRGYPVAEWVKKFDRNEALDCRVYARAAASIVGIDRWKPHQFDELVKGYTVKNDVKPEAKKKRERGSSFW